MPAAAYLAWKTSITSALTPAVISKFERSLPHHYDSDHAQMRVSMRRAMGMLKSISNHFVITTTDKATGSFAVICKLWYTQHLAAALQSDTYVRAGSSPAVTVREIYERVEPFQVPVDTVATLDAQGSSQQHCS